MKAQIGDGVQQAIGQIQIVESRFALNTRNNETGWVPRFLGLRSGRAFSCPFYSFGFTYSGLPPRNVVLILLGSAGGPGLDLLRF